MTDGLDEIYRQYADMVKKFLISLTGDVDLSEELMQETFYQAVLSIRRYNGECKMSVWLCQIAKHRYYDYLKKQKHRSRRFSGDIAELLSLPSQERSVEDAVLDKAEAEYLLRCIELMHEPYGKVFMMRLFGELSFREIGEIFGKTESWARVTYYRAKEKLKRKADMYENNV